MVADLKTALAIEEKSLAGFSQNDDDASKMQLATMALQMAQMRLRRSPGMDGAQGLMGEQGKFVESGAALHGASKGLRIRIRKNRKVKGRSLTKGWRNKDLNFGSIPHGQC